MRKVSFSQRGFLIRCTTLCEGYHFLSYAAPPKTLFSHCNIFLASKVGVILSRAPVGPAAHTKFGMRKYGPDVPVETLQSLSAAFTDVRSQVDSGTLTYPYSTRELVNIVKHLQSFPAAPLHKVFEL